MIGAKPGHVAVQSSVDDAHFTFVAGREQQLTLQALRIQTQKELRTTESGLTTLASIGGTAPFVGLFGTV